MNKFEVRDLNLYYGQFHALKGVSMDIPEKEVTAFIGPSGCGKSTFLKTLNRMNDLVEGCRITGDVKLDGVPAPTASAAKPSWTRSSSGRCAAPPSGTRSRTG